jgi:hypothetical protein
VRTCFFSEKPLEILALLYPLPRYCCAISKGKKIFQKMDDISIVQKRLEILQPGSEIELDRRSSKFRKNSAKNPKGWSGTEE